MRTEQSRQVSKDYPGAATQNLALYYEARAKVEGISPESSQRDLEMMIALYTDLLENCGELESHLLSKVVERAQAKGLSVDKCTSLPEG